MILMQFSRVVLWMKNAMSEIKDTWENLQEYEMCNTAPKKKLAGRPFYIVDLWKLCVFINSLLALPPFAIGG